VSSLHFCFVNAVFICYSVLSSIVFETISYMMFYSLLLIILYGRPIFLNILFSVVTVFFLNFRKLLILVCLEVFPFFLNICFVCFYVV
jgi:hypothetical protein